MTDDEVEIVTEKTPPGRKALRHDAMMRKLIGNRAGFQLMYHCYDDRSVSENLGFSVAELLVFCEGRLTIPTVTCMIVQLLTRLKDMTHSSVVHNDICSETVRVGFGKMGCVFYLVNFSRAQTGISTQRAREKRLSQHDDLMTLYNLVLHLIDGKREEGRSLMPFTAPPPLFYNEFSSMLDAIWEASQARDRVVDIFRLHRQAAALHQPYYIWSENLDWEIKKYELIKESDETEGNEKTEGSGMTENTKPITVPHPDINVDVSVFSLFHENIMQSPSFSLLTAVSREQWKQEVMDAHHVAKYTAMRVQEHPLRKGMEPLLLICTDPLSEGQNLTAE